MQRSSAGRLLPDWEPAITKGIDTSQRHNHEESWENLEAPHEWHKRLPWPCLQRLGHDPFLEEAPDCASLARRRLRRERRNQLPIIVEGSYWHQKRFDQQTKSAKLRTV